MKNDTIKSLILLIGLFILLAVSMQRCNEQFSCNNDRPVDGEKVINNQ